MNGDLCKTCQGYGQTSVYTEDQGTETLRCERCLGRGFELAHASLFACPEVVRAATERAVEAFIAADEERKRRKV